LDFFWREKIKTKDEKMRLFISLDIPKEVKDNLYRIQKYIPSNLAKIKWVPKKNLHITLKFLGEVDETLLAEIKKRLSNIQFKSDKLKFKEIDFFSSKKNPGVIKLSFFDSEKTLELQRKIDEAFIDIFPAGQKFVLHLTLGRVKIIKKKNELNDKIKSFDFFNKEFVVESFGLVESIPLKGTHIYKAIEIFET
jgi:RNA 2',3'-cyclic 3'-phosphodiesterase